MIYIEPCEETFKRFEDNSIDLIMRQIDLFSESELNKQLN